jgi:peptide chain release factor subunit 1
MEINKRFMFIVINGNGCLFAIVHGEKINVIQRMMFDLPRSMGRGGASAERLKQRRVEKKLQYMKQCADLALQHFKLHDFMHDIDGIVIAGCADQMHTELMQHLDKTLQDIVQQMVNVSYGFEAGLNQAISKIKIN